MVEEDKRTDKENPRVVVPKEIAAMIRAGEEFEQLIKLPAWHKLLDRLEQKVNQAMLAMSESKSNDPKVKCALLDTWKRAQQWFDLIQVEALTPIKMKQEAKSEIRSIMRQEMGEISEDEERRLEENGELPKMDRVWDFEEI